MHAGTLLFFSSKCTFKCFLDRTKCKSTGDKNSGDGSCLANIMIQLEEHKKHKIQEGGKQSTILQKLGARELSCLITALTLLSLYIYYVCRSLFASSCWGFFVLSFLGSSPTWATKQASTLNLLPSSRNNHSLA